MAVLFPALPGPPLPCSPLALRRQGQCSCQPGSGGESKSSFANAAEITGFISGHMAVSSGREEAAAASLPNSQYLWSIYMLCISGFSSHSGCSLWQDDAAPASGGRGYPAHRPRHANYRQVISATSIYYGFLPDLSRIAYQKNEPFLNVSIKHRGPPLETTTQSRDSSGGEGTRLSPPQRWVPHPCSEVALNNHEGHKHESTAMSL